MWINLEGRYLYFTLKNKGILKVIPIQSTDYPVNYPQHGNGDFFPIFLILLTLK